MFSNIKNKLFNALKIAKKWLKSKTVNFGLLLSLAGVIQANAPYLRGIFSNEQQYGFFMIALGVIVILLRSITTKRLEDK